jgi:aryl-alcohol dehydrogenase-like predicted oxidoreductase
MLNRREWIEMTAGITGALVLHPRLLSSLQQGELLRRAIPSSGEMLPVVGLGSSATFSRMAEIAGELGVADRIFWATKVNVAGRGGGTADAAAARAQIDDSFRKLGVDTVDLIQVHNLGDVPTQLGILKELKGEGRIRYLGVTTTSERQYAELERIMRNEPLDFIGIDYAVDNRTVESAILPLAQERKIGVLVYLPFGRTRLWQRVEGRELPEWASEFDATSWAQFFIKFILGHPAVTVVTPATSNPKHMADNIGGGIGRLPDDAMRERMAALVEELPPAPARG